jgi:alkanesulfonate monooxygenase SsuD/methylene tetrahydromethanopterin reductase-like flavin-dependent oxidoreductase (luciferase family)
MAGSVADGVFIRVGTHRANIARSIAAIHEGAVAAGRDPSTVGLGAIFHTVLVDDRRRALLMGKSMAAGYYEYSPMLFDGLFAWSGPDPETLKRDQKVWPDFHHAADLEASGRVVDFLADAAADAFSLHGGPAEIVTQVLDVLRASPAPFDHVVLHPIPDPRTPEDHEHGYKARVAREILPPLRAALGQGDRP